MIKGINGIHHVSITVPDLEEGVRFYCGVLGFEKVIQFDWPVEQAHGDDAARLSISIEEAMTQMKRIHNIPEDEETEGSAVMMRAGNAYFELFEFRKPKSPDQGGPLPTNHPGIMHIALDVTDLEDLYPRLKAAGVEFHVEPQRSADIVTTYGRDPFGNILEFQEIPPGSSVKARIEDL